MPAYSVGIDLGSSGVKVTLLDECGRITGPYSCELMTYCPAPGQVEQDPREWVEAVKDVLRRAFTESGIAPSQTACLTLDAATHTTVLLDGDLRPIRRAILWNDTRSAQVAARLRKSCGADIFDRTFHMPNEMWSLPQLMWVRENEPEIWAKTRRLLFEKDYVRMEMGGDLVTDRIDAEGSQLFNLKEMAWDPVLCGLLDIGPEMLPEVIGPRDTAGKVSRAFSEATGIPEGTPILAGASDTAMEVLAAGALRPGDATLKLATSGRICIVSEEPRPHPMLVNYSHLIDGLWYPGTGTRSCATSMRWFRDVFCQGATGTAAGGLSFAQLDRMASEVPAGCDGLMYHPFLIGEFTPYQDPYLRASFTGMSMSHTLGHFARAVMEGTAYSLLDCLSCLRDVGLPEPQAYRLIGGGAAGAAWSQIVADVFQVPMVRPAVSDSSYGSALTGAVARGWFSSYEAAMRETPAGDVIETDPQSGAVYREGIGVYREIVQRLKSVYDRVRPAE